MSMSVTVRSTKSAEPKATSVTLSKGCSAIIAAAAACTSLLKELGAKQVVSRASRDVQAKFLLRNGADHVVYPEKQLAIWTAIRYSSENLFDYVELDDTHAIFEISVPAAWGGRTVGEVNIRRKYGINIMAVKMNGAMDMAISAETPLPKDATMLVLGRNEDVQKCFHI